MNDPHRLVERVWSGMEEHEQERARITRYERQQEIGRGGCAVVYRARDRELDRVVALKVLQSDTAFATQSRPRFRREARTLARFDHPHIVRLFDCGEDGGQPFLAMEFVEGSSLAEVLRSRKGEMRDLIAILEKAARGVAYAHEFGVVHRDLKPSNILVSSSGEPKVADFGLAHFMNPCAALTKTGEVVGTPTYMAPEQIDGRHRELSPRADVYALGAILYEILTGVPPHTGANASELFAKILHRDPMTPRKRNAKVPADLETVCLKALEKDPGRRYGDAKQFAGELKRWLGGEAVEAKAVSPIHRAWRRVTRSRKTLIPILAGLAIALASGTWVGVGIVRKMSQVRRRLQDAREREGRRRIVEAAKRYREILAQDPGNREALDGTARTASALAAATRIVDESQLELDRALGFFLYSKDASVEDFHRRLSEIRGRLESTLLAVSDDARALYLLGRCHEAVGEEHDAEIYWRKALALDADLVPARYHLAGLRLIQICCYAYYNPFRPTSHDEWKTAYQELLAQAQQELDRLGTTPASSEVADMRDLLVAIVIAVRGEGRGESIVADRLARPPEQGKESFLWLWSLGHPDPNTELSLLNRALELCPKHYLSLYARALHYVRSGLHGEAVADLGRVIEIRPRWGDPYLERARAYAAIGEIERGILDCDAAVRLKPNDAGAHYQRGELEHRRGDFRAALPEFSSAIELDPRFAEAWGARAAVEVGLGLNDDAELDFAEAIRLSPKDPVLYASRSNLWAAMGKHDKQMSDINTAIDLEPREGDHYISRSQAFRDRKDLEGAARDAERAVLLLPESSDAFLARGLVRWDLGDLHGAIEDLLETILLGTKPHVCRGGRCSANLRRMRMPGGLLATRLDVLADILIAVEDHEKRLGLEPEPQWRRVDERIHGLLATNGSLPDLRGAHGILHVIWGDHLFKRTETAGDHWVTAGQELAAASAATPQSAALLEWNGRLCLLRGKLKEGAYDRTSLPMLESAVDYCTKSIERDPLRRGPFCIRGAARGIRASLMRKLGRDGGIDLGMAEEDFRVWLEAYPADAAVLYTRGRMRFEFEKYADALADLDRVPRDSAYAKQAAPYIAECRKHLGQ